MAETVRVEVGGLDDELRKNVLAFLSIAKLGKERGKASQPLDASDVQRLHVAARGEIAEALQPFGYYEPTVRATLEHAKEGWIARYDVDRGPATVIGAVEVRAQGAGNGEPAVRDAVASAVFMPGEVLLHTKYEAAKQRLFEAAYAAGYIDAKYQRAEILVRRDAREADIRLVLDTGPKYYFGPVHIEQDILDPRFVDRFVRIEPGEPFNSSRLIELQLALSDSGYFNEVTVDPARANAVDRHVPINVHTSPRQTQEYTVGIGYGTDTGPRLRLGTELRRLNEHGHRFKADLRVSGIATTAAGEYQVPVKNVTTDTLSYRAAIGTQDFGDLETDQISLGMSLNDAWRSLRRRTYLIAERERWTESGETRTEDVLYPGMQLSSRPTVDSLFTRQGHSWSADVRGGSDNLGSAESFLRLHVTGNLVRPLAERMRFLIRSEYGAMRADDLGRVPPSQRFFAGGDRSVRGYRYQKLGPTDAAGAVVGGRYLVTASAEVDYLFFRNYGAAMFFDAGNAANEPWPKLDRSVGIGMRWKSQVGMLRIDIAHPLDDPDTDYRLHLSIGSDL
ncbi:MAG TPA: autotransporter assembly complex family protein [Gammaproteobacteria bacterium]|nr:autotransporter assembly complex family protein [Gammaproteobacteria bacterium]